MLHDEIRDRIKSSSLGQMESGVRTAVINAEFSTGGQRHWQGGQLPDDLTQLRANLWYLDDLEQKNCRKELRRRSRAWRADRKAIHLSKVADYKRRQSTFIPPSTFKIGGETTGDRSKWNHGLEKFIGDRYFKADIDQTNLKQQLGKAVEISKHEHRGSADYLSISLGDVVGARAHLKLGSAGGEDGL
eukprot:8926745-Karenia_brevis.AAC.1